MEEIYRIINVNIISQQAEAQPPLGTVLGNIGVNAVKFCSEFNTFTRALPDYIKVGVKITVFNNRTYKFEITDKPNLGDIFRFLRRSEYIVTKRREIISYYVLSLKDLVQMALYKFPNSHLYNAICVLLAYFLPFRRFLRIIFYVSPYHQHIDSINTLFNKTNIEVSSVRKMDNKKRKIQKFLTSKKDKEISDNINRRNNRSRK